MGRQIKEADMNGKLNKLRMLSFVAFVLVVLPVFLCGCESKADRDAATHLKLGKIEFEAGRLVEAMDAFDKAIAIKPDYAEAYFLVGKVCDKLRKRDDAIAAYKKCVAIEPTGENAAHARKRMSDLMGDKIDKWRNELDSESGKLDPGSL
jgi:tetratricopeptide (TPR) repeat protein